jgi:hypothetical protein
VATILGQETIAASRCNRACFVLQARADPANLRPMWRGISFRCLLGALVAGMMIGCDAIIGIENTAVSAGHGQDAGPSDAPTWSFDPKLVHWPAVAPSPIGGDASVDAAAAHTVDSGSDSGSDAGSDMTIADAGHRPDKPLDPMMGADDGDGGDDDADGGFGAGDVRAPSEFSGLVMWLDAARGVEVSGLAGNWNVSHWNDRSSNANHAGQSDVERQPRLLTAAANNLPAVEFNGHDNYLMVQDSTSLDLDTDDFAIVMVAAWDNVTTGDPSPAGETWGYGMLIAKQHEEQPNGGFVMFANADVRSNGFYEGRLWFIVGDAEVVPQLYATASVNDDLNDGAFRVYSARRTESTTMEVRVNGVAVGQETIPSALSVSAPGQPMRIGGQTDLNIKQPLSGMISEIVIVRGATSDAELSQLEMYFNRKYQLWR